MVAWRGVHYVSALISTLSDQAHSTVSTCPSRGGGYLLILEGDVEGVHYGLEQLDIGSPSLGHIITLFPTSLSVSD